MRISVDIPRMDTKNQNGFTLIELLVALAVAAILLGIGIPSFSGAIKNSRVSADYSEITQALFMARSEAVKSRSRVTVCPKKALDAMQCGSVNTDWEHGWLVFVDNVFATNAAAASIDAEDEIISVHPKQRSKNTITAIGSSDRTAQTAHVKTYIAYESEGQSSWANGSFLICNADDVELSRVLNVAPTGDVRPGRPSGTKKPRDVFNREAC